MLRTISLPIPPAVPAAAEPAKPNLIRRLYAAIIASRQRRAEREIADYLARSGLKFTDAVERDMERHFFFHRPFN
jgi:hypothetical protein